MKNTHKAYKSFNKQTIIFLLALSISILFLVTTTNVMAQMGYTDIYFPGINPPNSFLYNYNWQNVNQFSNSFYAPNYQMYPIQPSPGWNQMAPSHGLNYLPNNYGFQNYQYISHSHSHRSINLAHTFYHF